MSRHTIFLWLCKLTVLHWYVIGLAFLWKRNEDWFNNVTVKYLNIVEDLRVWESQIVSWNLSVDSLYTINFKYGDKKISYILFENDLNSCVNRRIHKFNDRTDIQDYTPFIYYRLGHKKTDSLFAGIFGCMIIGLLAVGCVFSYLFVDGLLGF